VACNRCLLACVALAALGSVLFTSPASLWAESPKKDGRESATKIPAKKESIGNPHAAWLIEQMVKEINNGLKERGIADRFAAFQEYAGWQLDISAGKAETSEVTGNCRVTWYDHLMRKTYRLSPASQRHPSRVRGVLPKQCAWVRAGFLHCRWRHC
jgi:hypothetical protein